MEFVFWIVLGVLGLCALMVIITIIEDYWL